MKGTATISLDDLDLLRKQAEEAVKAKDILRDVQSAMDVILRLTGNPSGVADAFNSKGLDTMLKLSSGEWRLERRR